MSAQVRWDCPNGLHRGVLASTRPRKNATVRYCLPCSESEGVLVERVAPALERKRAARSSSAASRAAAKREREKAERVSARTIDVLNADGSPGTLDVEDTMRRMLRLPSIREATPEWLGSGVPKYKLRRRKDGAHVSGHAYPRGSICLTIPPGCVREYAEELILHELCHYVLPTDTHHDSTYRNLLVAAAREFWPCEAVRKVRNEGSCYSLDTRLWEAAWRTAHEEARDA